jgi:peptidyl-tRNA hydrolase
VQVWPPSLEKEGTVNLLKEGPRMLAQTCKDLQEIENLKMTHENSELPEHLKRLYNESIQQVGNKLKEGQRMLAQTCEDLQEMEHLKKTDENTELPEHLKRLYNESIQQVENKGDREKSSKC